jgi:uncharacterized membrane-anchored protein
MKKIFIWGTTVFIVVAVGLLIVNKEKTLANGQSMLLRLAPVDPRSLIQGDYMILRCAIAGQISETQLNDKGYIVVSLDENNVGKFVRMHNGDLLQPGEYLLSYRNRGGLRLGAESFMFQEGHARRYSKARYGELKVADSGAGVLVGLRGEGFEPLGREHKK